MAYELVVNRTFGGRIEDRDHVISVYRAHIAEVQGSIPAARLLTYDVAEGWGPLCAFLGITEPEDPFPMKNSTEEFQARAATRAATREGQG